MNIKHDRKLVLKKGVDLFWHKGFHHLGVDEICRETGMTKGAFYNAFKSKENFLLTTIEFYGDYIVDHLQSQLSKSELTAFERLRNLYSEMLFAQPENGFKGCLVNNMMSELGALNQTVAERTGEQFDKFINVIQPIVREVQEQGDFSLEISSRQLSEIIHTTFFGFLTRSKSVKMSTSELMILFLNTIKK